MGKQACIVGATAVFRREMVDFYIAWYAFDKYRQRLGLEKCE